MKKVIIGIHGLGNKPPKYLLTKWWKDAISEGFKTHGIHEKLPEFELAYWADILHDEPLDKWEKDTKNPNYIDEPYKKADDSFKVEDTSFRTKVVDFITHQVNKIFLNDDKTLNYSFITDFILRNYFKDLEAYYKEECSIEPDITCKAKDLIRNRIVETIEKYKDYDILIIAHSMGSIIGMDVLNFSIPDIKINTLVTIGSPLGLPIVIAKMAAEQKLRRNGKTQMATPSAITNKWFNMADIMDKVALNYKLSDDFVKNSDGVVPEDYLVINNYQIKDHKNPHKSFGYLRTPEISTILSEFIVDEKMNIGHRIKHNFRRVLERMKVQRDKVKDTLNIN